MSNIIPDEKTTCPATGHKKLCSKLYQNCPKWIHVQGSNPLTGELMNEGKCSDNWQMFVEMENTRKIVELGAAVESFRNEFVKLNSNFVTGIQSLAQQAIDNKSGE